MRRIVAQGPGTALDHTFSYLGRYLLLGFIPVLILILFMPSPGLGFVCGILHLLSVALFFPGSLAINYAALCLARGRNWNLQPWRAWAGGALGVALVWGVGLGVTLLKLRPTDVLDCVIGAQLAALIHYGGLLLSASALALGAAWALPARRGNLA